MPVPARRYTAEDAQTLLAAFEAAYRPLYSRIIPGVEVEILSWVLTVSAPVAAGTETRGGAGADARPSPRRTARSSTRRPARSSTSRSMRARDLTPGAAIAGPAVIVEDETSTVVSPRFDALIDGFGYIELRRRTA